LDIPVVLVSPLRRTITTAYYIFNKHPNFSKMKFVLAPLAREALLGAGDIPSDLDEVVNRYSSWFPTGLDTSEFDHTKKQGWYLNTL
jgi:hypothetical protein